MLMLYGAFFITVTLIGYVCYLIPHERKNRIRQRLAKLTLEESATGGGGAEQRAEDAKMPSLGGRLWRASISKFRRQFHRRTNERKQLKIEQLLAQAGRPLGMLPADFRLLQLAIYAAVPVLTGAYCYFLLQTGMAKAILWSFGSLLLAWRLPYAYLSFHMKKRAKEIQKELPDVLDLLTVSLEAGLGFDSAIGKLVSKKSGILASEFHRCLEEIRLGRTRREALIGLRDRISLDEMRALIGSILQAEKLGIGMVQTMRVQSAEMRDRRKQRAEEAAMKAPIKMLFPLVLFVFPCLFIVLLGPVLIQFIETFGGGSGLP